MTSGHCGYLVRNDAHVNDAVVDSCRWSRRRLASCSVVVTQTGGRRPTSHHVLLHYSLRSS